MSQDQEKYLYFTVGLLKNSFALDALRQDALKYHMVDQPGQLIALRLTEYYELMTRGSMYPGANVPPMAAPPAATSNGVGKEEMTVPGATNGEGADNRAGEALIVETSPDVEQNADDAAEYWSRL